MKYANMFGPDDPCDPSQSGILWFYAFENTHHNKKKPQKNPTKHKQKTKRGLSAKQ